MGSNPATLGRIYPNGARFVAFMLLPPMNPKSPNNLIFETLEQAKAWLELELLAWVATTMKDPQI